MERDDLQNFIDEWARTSKKEYEVFDHEFRRAYKVMQWIASLPCNEMRNAYLDQHRIFLALSKGKIDEARLWAERARKHVALATHDCLATLYEFEIEFADALVRRPENQGSPNYSDIKKEIKKCQRRRSKIRKPPARPQQTIKATRKDIAKIERTNISLQQALISSERLFFELGSVLGGSAEVRKALKRFAQDWAS